MPHFEMTSMIRSQSTAGAITSLYLSADSFSGIGYRPGSIASLGNIAYSIGLYYIHQVTKHSLLRCSLGLDPTCIYAAPSGTNELLQSL